MSGETIVVYGTQKTLQDSSASSLAVANNTIQQAMTAGYAIATDGASYPDAEFVLTGTFGTAPTDGTVLALYAQPLAIDGANNAQAPDTTRPTFFVGTFVVNSVTTQQSMNLLARDLPANANYYIHNNGTGQQLNAGWTLKVTPRSYKAAA